MNHISHSRYTIERVDGRLELRAGGESHGVYLKLDDLRRRLRQGRGLALAKACGVRPRLRVLDGMAGFGLDGITLAALGCDVWMVERDPLLFTLLEDAIARARESVPIPGTIECSEGDVRDVLAAGDAFDAIYLDPMFPSRDKAALPRKSAQVLADLIGVDDGDLADVVSRATPLARKRVVVKRRRHDVTLAVPDWQIFGRSVRFDVYKGTAVAESG